MHSKIPKFIFLLLSVFFISTLSYAYDGLLFKPLTASTFEPRIGGSYQFGYDKLRLDIGSSVDLTDFKLSDKNETRIGADFFTYTRLRSVGRFKFPVETADYFFGINSSTKGECCGLNYSGRFRLAHISSHVVDGLAHDTVLTKKPFVYSREFVDITGAINWDNFRIYAGLWGIFSVQPDNNNPVIPELGFDYNYPITDWLNANIGYDFKLGGYGNVYSGISSAECGATLLTSKDREVWLGALMYDGYSIHGMFYDKRDSYLALGFRVIFY